MVHPLKGNCVEYLLIDTYIDGNTREFGFSKSGTYAQDIRDHLDAGDIVIAVLKEHGFTPQRYFSNNIAIDENNYNKAQISFDGYVDGNYMYKYILDCERSSVEGELYKIPITPVPVE